MTSDDIKVMEGTLNLLGHNVHSHVLTIVVRGFVTSTGCTQKIEK